MIIHIITPFSTEKDLGKAYNNACKSVPDEDWICITDYDVLFLTPETVNNLYYYAKNYSGCFLTALTNRIHPINTEQLYQGKLSQSTDIADHIKIAQSVQNNRDVKELKDHLSGFLMLFPKMLWNRTRFDEGMGCLGVDTNYFKKLKQMNVTTLVMQGVYIFHLYRLINGIKDKSHLK